MENQNNKIQGDMNGFLSNYLIKERTEAVQPYLKGKRRILDIGCGVFRWGGLLPPDAEYIGIDFEDAIIRYNQSHFQHKFITFDAETDNLDILGDKFDLIMILAVIEHFNRPEIVLEKIKSILDTEGIIVLTTPHPIGNYILELGSKIGIFARDKYQHRDLLDYRKIERLATDRGYRIDKYKRFLYGFNQLVVLKKA